MTLLLEVVESQEVLGGGAEKTPTDLTGAKVFFSLKASISDPDPPLLAKTSDDSAEINILAPETDGKAEIYLLGADTNALGEGTFDYDIWVELSSGSRYPVVRDGQLVISSAVTTFA